MRPGPGPPALWSWPFRRPCRTRAHTRMTPPGTKQQCLGTSLHSPNAAEGPGQKQTWGFLQKQKETSAQGAGRSRLS